jgi:hypothetical protein
MQLPIVSRAAMITVPPIYKWPQSVKRVLFISAVIATIVAYALLGGGIIAFLALLAEWIG